MDCAAATAIAIERECARGALRAALPIAARGGYVFSPLSQPAD